MATHTVTRTIAAPSTAVWTLLEDFGDVRWIPLAGKVDVEGSGPGMCRFIFGSGDTPVVERLIAVDPGTRTLTYSIDRNNPIPTTTFVAVASVSDGPKDGCTISWEVDVEPSEGATLDEVTGAMDAIYGMMADWLRDAAGADAG